MARKCDITGKKPAMGYKYAIRGIAKKRKGIGLKITGKTKRRHNPNLFVKRLWSPEKNCFIKLKVSAAGLRTVDKKGLDAVFREMNQA